MTPTVLHRGVWARLRTIRVYEIAAWIAVVAFIVGSSGGVGSGGLGLWIVGVAGAVIRLAIAVEYVRCDATGITWRSLFVTHQVGWAEITNLDVSARPMRLPVRGTRGAMTTCLTIERGAGTPLVYVNPSLLVPLARLGDFVAAARLMSPKDWSEPEDQAAHRPSGKRVGRPTRRPRR